ncbi:hypothetical protein BZG36_01975 [Bifiguratus adelaidae]|uniref:Uncharacterized protein n=1 Tax=Bifiguratus adelaidae TaxID=1938954 RepID=A0A261Y460_9FUNG|nr:hypothetical protein BZG36_01975 [Bifiguratus adelaidae]
MRGKIQHKSFYNWAGCTIGGSNHEAAKIARESLQPFVGPSTSSVLGYQGCVKSDAQHAALFNGIASHVHDFDDTHLKTIIHPSGPVCSALLAYAEWKRPVSGRDFIVALVAGIEVECKVGLAVWPNHYDIGWHITGTTGSIGAAAAVGKLMGLDVPAMQHAIGIAATQVVGLRDMFGSHTKSFHPGRAAQCGLLSAILASNGYTSSMQALESKRGWANVVSTSNDLSDQVNSLGKTWEISENAFKPFPCGIVCHPIIDGCIQLHRELKNAGIDVSEVEDIQAKVHPLVLELTGKRQPQDGLQGKFSVYHSGAVGLVYAKAGVAQYADSAVKDALVVNIRDKMQATADSNLRADEAILTVTVKGGRQFEKHIHHAVGSLEVPMTNEQLEEKFKDQAMLVLGDAKVVDRASVACWNLESAQDVAEIASVL